MTLIQGPSGCGKSTFLKIVAGLLKPLSGQVLFPGQIKKIGYLHQDIHLIEHWSLEENLSLVDSNKTHQKKWLELFDLKMNPNSIAGQLSGGEKQRVGLVRIMLSNPDLILLDEPTAHLDDKHTSEALQLIKKQFLNKALVVVSHDQRVQKYSEHILNWQKETANGV